MAALDDHQGSSAAHILCVGSNGSGKTGALVSLARAGYWLRILDFDGGTEIIKQLLKDDPQEVRDRVDIETFVDKYAPQIGSGALRPIPSCNAFEKGMQCATKWPETKHGPSGSPLTWGTDTILATDSLTYMGRAAQNHVAKMKGKLASLDPKDMHPSQPDWGDAMGLQENFCAMMMGLNCHVIVNAHVTFLTQEGETAQEGFPSALGSKLPPKIGGYFNSTLYFTKEGFGQNKKQIIRTKGNTLVNTKTPAPGKVQDTYPLETGLADYFKALHGTLKAAA